MGLLDSVRGAVSGAVNTVRETVSTTVHKVEDKAAAVAQEAKSVFDPKPSAPPPPPPAKISSNPTVSARQAALNPALLRNDLSIAAGKPAEGPEATAKALIKKHTSFPAQLDEAALGNELKDMVNNDPATAAPILKAVMKELHSSDVDDVSIYVAEAKPENLRKLAMTPEGPELMKQMQEELSTGWKGSDDMAAWGKLNDASTKAQDNEDAGVATEKKEIASALVYAKNGHKEFNLNDPAAVKDLIVNSPQLDNLSGTTTDSKRCAGAAVLNAMLLSGDHTKNAAAIESAASKVNVQPGISADERSALDAMKKGSMTPTDAAHLQELIVRSAKTETAADKTRTNFQRGGPEGVSPQGLADFAQLLRKEGAFANAKSVTFHAEKAHWTVSVTNKNGETIGANSFPDDNSNGKATLKKMDGKSTYTEFSIENGEGGKVKFSAGAGVPGRSPIKGVDSGFIEPGDSKFDFQKMMEKWALALG